MGANHRRFADDIFNIRFVDGFYNIFLLTKKNIIRGVCQSFRSQYTGYRKKCRRFTAVQNPINQNNPRKIGAEIKFVESIPGYSTTS